MAYGDVLVHTTGPSYGQNIVRNVGVSSGGGGGGAPDAHAASHEDGGSDEIDLTGLAGAFPNPMPDDYTLMVGADGEGGLVFRVGPGRVLYTGDLTFTTDPGSSVAVAEGQVNIYSAGVGELDYAQMTVLSAGVVDFLVGGAAPEIRFRGGPIVADSMPTTTDPSVTGEFFTCTAGELAGLLAAGAKHILLSKGP